MRTTLSVDDHLLEAARRRARDRDQTLGQVVEDALRRELGESSLPDPVDVPIFRGGSGPRAGIDLTSNRAMREALDHGVEFDTLR
jgi:hypothetical protein